MAKPKELTEEQEVLLSFAPNTFEGKQSEKLVYGTLIYCSQCEKERSSSDTFSVGMKTLMEKTGYGRTVISTVIQNLIKLNKIKRMSMGNSILNTNSAYSIVEEDSEHRENTIVNIGKNYCEHRVEDTEHREIVNTVDSEHRKIVNIEQTPVNQGFMDSEHRVEDSEHREIVNIDSEHRKNEIVNTNYNFNYNNNKNTLVLEDPGETQNGELEDSRHMDLRLSKLEEENKELKDRLDKAAKIIAQLAKRINALEESANNAPADTCTTSTGISTNNPTGVSRTKINEEFGKLMETCNGDANITIKSGALNRLLQLRSEYTLSEKQCKVIDDLQAKLSNKVNAALQYKEFGILYNNFRSKKTQDYNDALRLIQLRDILTGCKHLNEFQRQQIKTYGDFRDDVMVTVNSIIDSGSST